MATVAKAKKHPWYGNDPLNRGIPISFFKFHCGDIAGYADIPYRKSGKREWYPEAGFRLNGAHMNWQ